MGGCCTRTYFSVRLNLGVPSRRSGLGTPPLARTFRALLPIWAVAVAVVAVIVVARVAEKVVGILAALVTLGHFERSWRAFRARDRHLSSTLDTRRTMKSRSGRLWSRFREYHAAASIRRSAWRLVSQRALSAFSEYPYPF